MSNIGTSANALLPELVAGEDFTFPDIDLNSDDFDYIPGDINDVPITALTLASLTTQTVGGSGSFDVIMTSLRAHLMDEYEKSRITGDQYTKAYIALVTAALSSGVQFLLQKDQAFWQGVLAKAQAIRAEVEVVTAKVGLQTARAQLAIAKFNAMTAEVQYALGKAELAKAGVDYDTAVYNLSNVLPAQKDNLVEQGNAARAQTLNTRFDGSTVAGTVATQKALYTQQITSYQRDAEIKMAKMWTDTWTVMKTVDDGLEAPTAFSNANINDIMTQIRVNNNLD